MHEYSQAELKRLFHLSKTLQRALVRAGYLTAPARSGKTGYSFQDLLILKTAGALQRARISAPKIIQALGNIRAALPPGAMLRALTVSASGKDMAVRQGAQVWEAGTGQFVLPLPAQGAAKVAAVGRTPAASPAAVADRHFARGHALEDSDLEAARGAYLAALEARADHEHARINLGRLLHLAGDLHAAERVYRGAKRDSALLSFNLAVLLEDLHREREAAAAYRLALAQDPSLHDAHFNLSRLYELGGQPREALRHLLAYRRQVQSRGP